MDRKILIVEDNLPNMRLIEIVLRGKDYTLLKATDGDEALEIVFREQPDLTITDIQLPKLSGLEVTRRLRQTPGIQPYPHYCHYCLCYEGRQGEGY